MKKEIIYNGKNIVSLANGVSKKWIATYKSMKLEHTLLLCTKKVNSKWLKDLDISHDTIKLLEEIIGKTVSYIDF